MRTAAALFAATALLVATALPARAERIHLKGGRVLDVDELEIKAKAVNVTIRKDGGTARVDLPFERLEPKALLALIDRHTDPQSGSARMMSARLALRLGMRAEATERFEQAAALDPALAEEGKAALAALAKREAADALSGLEKLLRAGGDPRAVITRAAALLEGLGASRFEAGELLRISTIARLAQMRFEQQVTDPAAGLVPEPGGPLPEPKPDAPQQPQPDPDAKPAPLSETAQRVLAELDKARHARDRAADPALSLERAVRYLETAARVLLDGRRALQQDPKAFGAETDDVYATLHALLVATYLDLADLYRQQGRYDDARAMLRSALILDPGNEEAREQRQLIEEGIRQEAREFEEPRGVAFYRITPWGIGPFFRPHYPLGYGFGHHYGHPCGGYGGGVHIGIRIGGGHAHVHAGHHHGGHVTRHVGRRR